MKKILVNSLLVLSIVFAACGGKNDKKEGEVKETDKTEVKDQPVETKETAASIAAAWCDLNGKAHKATGADKEAAEKNRKDFEEAMEKKYGADKAFMDEIGKEVEKCEDASEGR